MTPDLVFAAVTVVGIAAAYHAFRTWVADRALARASDSALKDVSARLGALEMRTLGDDIYVTKDMQKALAEDWFRKFQQLERDINVVKSHTEAQLAGTLAAVGANTARGFNR